MYTIDKISYVLSFNGLGGAFVHNASCLGSDARDDVDHAVHFESAEEADAWAEKNIFGAENYPVERIYYCGSDAYCEVDQEPYAIPLAWGDVIIYGVRVN